MSDYISREAALEVFCRWCGICPKEKQKPLECDDILGNVLHSLPAADVVEVRHGRWVWKHRHHGGFRKYMGVDEFGETHTITVDERSECDEPYCPYCGKWNESVFLNYCPSCGADMREEDDHE